MVQFLSINFCSWISSIFVGFFKSSRCFVSLCTMSSTIQWFVGLSGRLCLPSSLHVWLETPQTRTPPPNPYLAPSLTARELICVSGNSRLCLEPVSCSNEHTVSCSMCGWVCFVAKQERLPVTTVITVGLAPETERANGCEA